MSRTRRRGWIAAIALLAVAGVVLIVLGLTSGPRAAAPIAAADTRTPVTVAAGPTPDPTTAAVPDLPASPPTRIAVPALGVDSPVNPVGLNPDGTVQVPAPGPRYDQAAWS